MAMSVEKKKVDVKGKTVNIGIIASTGGRLECTGEI
jgi:hypothetical protein